MATNRTSHIEDTLGEISWNTMNIYTNINIESSAVNSQWTVLSLCLFLQSKSQPQRRGEYNVYSTFQSHEPEFDYLKSLEIEEKINKIKWLPQQNAAYFLLSTNGQSVSWGGPSTVAAWQSGWIDHSSVMMRVCLHVGRVLLLLNNGVE